ncbi:MAG: GNAT family N-acetyltransferase [Spirochaetes bacterium]|nr:GNAT family N-acetyltransferase [Spirochaetota bacterium]
MGERLVREAEEFKDQVFLKAEYNSEIVRSVRGYCAKGTCYIGKLIVHPGYQNRGMGTKLMREIESRFGDADRYELFTGHEDHKNLHLYRKLGYSVFKETKVNDSLTMVFMEKRNESPSPA